MRSLGAASLEQVSRAPTYQLGRSKGVNMNVTFIGVGAIGLPMAVRIQRAGHDVTGVDVSESVIANAKSSGIETVGNIVDAPAAEVVVVMVATPDQLVGLVSRVGGAVRGQLWIIMSTVGPHSVREQGQVLQRAGAQIGRASCRERVCYPV